MKGEGRKGAGKDWAEILRGAFQVKGFTGVPPGLEKKKKKARKKGEPQRPLCKTAPLVKRIWGRKKNNCILLSEATWSNKRIAFAHLRMECEAPFRCSDRI